MVYNDWMLIDFAVGFFFLPFSLDRIKMAWLTFIFCMAETEFQGKNGIQVPNSYTNT